MQKINYFWAKVKYKTSKNPECLSNYYRKQGAKIGSNCLICNDFFMMDPVFVEVKNNVIISSAVSFITHDHSINKVILDKSNLFGKIIVGNNCFIGYGSILLYGVKLSDNIIVASGSVVTKSFEETNIIIGGNPATKIGTWGDFKSKYEKKAVCKDEVADILTNNIDKLVWK